MSIESLRAKLADPDISDTLRNIIIDTITSLEECDQATNAAMARYEAEEARVDNQLRQITNRVRVEQEKLVAMLS